MMVKIRRSKISTSMFFKGISLDGFKKLLNDIHEEVDESVATIGNYEALITELKSSKPSAETDAWIEKFKMQVTNSMDVINTNFQDIDSLFNRIFKDWEEHNSSNDERDNLGDNNE